MRLHPPLLENPSKGSRAAGQGQNLRGKGEINVQNSKERSGFPGASQHPVRALLGFMSQ